MIGYPSRQDGAILPALYTDHALVFFSHIINPLLTKLARSRWLDIGLVLFLRVSGTFLGYGPRRSNILFIFNYRDCMVPENICPLYLNPHKKTGHGRDARGGFKSSKLIKESIRLQLGRFSTWFETRVIGENVRTTNRKIEVERWKLMSRHITVTGELRKGGIAAKFPHSPILHYACGSMYVVLCFITKKQQKQRIVPQLLYCFCHYFPLTITCIHNEVWGCAEI